MPIVGILIDLVIKLAVIGLMHSKNIYPVSGYSIKYIYPSNPSLLVTDAGVNWNDNEGNDGIFIAYPNTGHTLQTNMQNKVKSISKHMFRNRWS